MLGGSCRFVKGSAEDRGEAARGISVCTGTSGGHGQDCSAGMRRTPEQLIL